MNKRYNRQAVLLFLALGLLIVFRGSAAVGVRGPAGTEREILTIPIAVYIMVSSQDTPALSSRRTVESMRRHFDQVNRIWSQADIVIEPVVVRHVEAPDYLLRGLSHRRGRGGLADFFKAIRSGVIDIGNIHKKGVMTSFYVRWLGGPNGLKPPGFNALLVADNTTVNDARVVSHEIGHNLGLFHAQYNTDLLLFSGSNGVKLTAEEQTVARYHARRILFLW